VELKFSTDKERIDLDFVHGYLSNDSYWAKGRAKDEIKRAIDNSFCISAFSEGEQVGFGRVVTDFQTFAYVMDVFVKPSKNNCGIGSQLMEALMSSSELHRIKRFTLATVEASGFYEKLGFKESGAHYMILDQENA
jgi:N-acetylglutamate synthase-like GNAT family acetyltransferase